MKTFNDLEFKQHAIITGIHAVLDFNNGYGVSVVQGGLGYCDKDTYEVGIRKDGCLYYKTPITGDVLSYQTPEDVTEVMRLLQEFKRDEY